MSGDLAHNMNAGRDCCCLEQSGVDQRSLLVGRDSNCVTLRGSTCECLLQLLLAGGSFQQASDLYDDMLEAGALAWVLTPAILHEAGQPLSMLTPFQLRVLTPFQGRKGKLGL